MVDGVSRSIGTQDNTTTEEVSVVMYQNVYAPNDHDEVEIFKADEHNGMTLDKIFNQISSILTVSEIDTIDEEEFVNLCFQNLNMEVELIARLEACMVSGWESPRVAQEDMVISTLDGLIMNLTYEVERELFGWKFTLFQEFGGNALMRSIKTRFNLLE